jgi:hypothetical protein
MGHFFYIKARYLFEALFELILIRQQRLVLCLIKAIKLPSAFIAYKPPYG